ncbi:Uncharacterised protein [Nocardiopsis dassonvillei]|uniref:Uncharacterized protein n=2 Tax=Nocardiopsidaceae TaxID=83676 RepID=D7B9C8_NOCDD|nr:hypothetical protein Ndas_5407 [Nocardiopsis dassonvillei subsp. dassonvillei DSM 43111]VEI90996.1 Uncharacterised protein [Nocardiopsis dassonvillei]
MERPGRGRTPAPAAPPWFHDPMARGIGKLPGISGTSDIVVAMVVRVAVETGATVLTSDPVDVGMIAEAVKARIPLATV